MISLTSKMVFEAVHISLKAVNLNVVYAGFRYILKI